MKRCYDMGEEELEMEELKRKWRWIFKRQVVRINKVAGKDAVFRPWGAVRRSLSKWQEDFQLSDGRARNHRMRLCCLNDCYKELEKLLGEYIWGLVEAKQRERRQAVGEDLDVVVVQDQAMNAVEQDAGLNRAQTGDFNLFDAVILDSEEDRPVGNAEN